MNACLFELNVTRWEAAAATATAARAPALIATQWRTLPCELLIYRCVLFLIVGVAVSFRSLFTASKYMCLWMCFFFVSCLFLMLFAWSLSLLYMETQYIFLKKMLNFFLFYFFILWKRIPKINKHQFWFIHVCLVFFISVFFLIQIKRKTLQKNMRIYRHVFLYAYRCG